MECPLQKLLTGVNGLNKRGSGVRRLVLVSFFKAEAERRLKTSNRRSIIYAIEEPETAQHPNNQRILIESFKSLAGESGCQLLLTTHSPGFASELPKDSIRFIYRDAAAGKPLIQSGVAVFGEVADALGVTPDSRVKVLLCVEGPSDVTALKCLSRALHAVDVTLPNLETDERIAFVVLGGGTLKHWVDENYLRALNRPELHIYDSDVAHYAQSVALVNARQDGSWATQTNKHEIESYLHPDAIADAFGVRIEVTDQPIEGKATPKLFAEAYSAAQGFDGVMKDSKCLGNKIINQLIQGGVHMSDISTKGCISCKQEKPFSAFYRKQRDDYVHECIDCRLANVAGLSTKQATLNSEQAMLEFTLLNAETSGQSFDDVVLEGFQRDIPPEVLTRMKSLWEQTKKIGNEVIDVGKIIVMKIIEFLKAHPKLLVSLAIGAAVYLLVHAIPLIGPLLAPLLAVGSTLFAFGTLSSLDDVIQLAKDFFALLVSIFNAVENRWAAAA